MSDLCDFGLIGLAVMGENLALNVESRGYKVAVFNRTTSVVDDFIAGRAAGKQFVGCHSVEEMVKNLARPRKVMMLIKAGPAVDAVIDQLIPLLDKGDIIIDGGNTYYADTERRTKYVEEQGLLFMRHRRLGRRRGRAQGPQHDARRIARCVAAREADLPGHRCQGWPEQRHPLLRLGGPSRRRALRQNGAQRHRVRRHAADLRSLLHAQAGARPHQRRSFTTCSPSGTRANSIAT